MAADSLHGQPARQQQFLETVDRDEAMRRFQSTLAMQPLGAETVALHDSLNRVLAETIVAPIDVPGFDRANVDGFALRAADTRAATEEQPTSLRLTGEILTPGVQATRAIGAGTASLIATGGMVPRGADCVVMVEDTDTADDETTLQIHKPAAPGSFITFTGTDIGKGETVLRAGELLTSREIGVLAAIGIDSVAVYRRPRVATLSTGDEIVAPGEALPSGAVHDSNAAILAAAVAELGGEPVAFGIVKDDEIALEEGLKRALDCDIVLLSGGTSKGAGDISYRVVARLPDPGVLVHGVALKPGKPICLAVTEGKPVAILPGFPTSAIFTFHEFIAPVMQAFAGQPVAQREMISARLPMQANSERGRAEYLLVMLMAGDGGLLAYPMGKGSGAVTTFSHADGFITIDQHTEIVPANSTVEVQLLSRRLEPADLVIIGSHCVGLDYLIGELQARGISTKAMAVGSQGGLAAAGRGECDLAGIHLMDPKTGEYNRPLLGEGLDLIRGYGRMQGIVYRPGDGRFEGRALIEAVAAALADSDCVMVNRNAGSGTRILIDRLLVGRQPPGYASQPKSHNAVATAVQQGRADWGVAIDTVASQYGLGFIELQEEQYDFAVPDSRAAREPVKVFRELLADPAIRAELTALGFRLGD